MNIPYVLESSNNSERVYDLYSKLLNNRIIFLQGEIDDRVSALVTSELLYLDSINNDDIKLYINSPGGSVTGGLAIYDTMNHIKSDVVTIGTGLCASMGAFLLSSGQKGKRYVLPNTEVMIHQPASMASGQATEIRIAADRIIKIKNKLNSILAKNTNKSIKKIASDCERDYFMDSKEALLYGVIDKII